jgi:hypothetical protein
MSLTLLGFTPSLLETCKLITISRVMVEVHHQCSYKIILIVISLWFLLTTLTWKPPLNYFGIPIFPFMRYASWHRVFIGRDWLQVEIDGEICNGMRRVGILQGGANTCMIKTIGFYIDSKFLTNIVSYLREWKEMKAN